jgi:hypothetical protein
MGILLHCLKGSIRQPCVWHGASFQVILMSVTDCRCMPVLAQNWVSQGKACLIAQLALEFSGVPGFDLMQINVGAKAFSQKGSITTFLDWKQGPSVSKES